MMRTILLISILMAISMVAIAQSNSITNISVQQRTDGSGMLDVSFELDGEAESYNVLIEVSFDGGNTYTPIPASYLSGELQNISTGSHNIVWDGYGSFPNKYSTQTVLKIVATADEEGGSTGQPCPGLPSFTDYRDGQTYNTVLIGDQCWMKENLRYLPSVVGPGTYSNTIPYYYIQGYDGTDVYAAKATSNYLHYGVLYNWPAAMAGASSSNNNPSGVKGVCPTGWHLPSHYEWVQLEQYVCNMMGLADCSDIFPYDLTTVGWTGSVVGNVIKSCRQVGSPLSGSCNTNEHPRWDYHETHFGTDEYGFSGLPGGAWNFNAKDFDGFGDWGVWWTSSERLDSIAWFRNIGRSTSRVNRSRVNKSSGYSIRCVKDASSSPDKYTLNLHVSPAGSGTVQGGGQYQAGDKVQISAMPNTGWQFVKWTDELYYEVSNNPEFQFTMPAANTTFTANFRYLGTDFICGKSTVSFIYRGKEVIFGTVTSANNRCWLDRNLGATQVATSSTDAASYGDLFQWGRLDDGHQVRTSPTTTTLSNSDVPGHGNFILAPNNPWDWRSPQNDDLWQGEGGINNPCPEGYRLPTEAEWNTERASWSTNDAAGAFGSPLKLPMAGVRNSNNGLLYDLGNTGHYWSSTVNDIYSWSQFFNSSNAFMYANRRARGHSVRCLKD